MKKSAQRALSVLFANFSGQNFVSGADDSGILED